jgi:hypothetical protein
MKIRRKLDITVNPPNPDGLVVVQIGMKDGSTKRIIVNGRIDCPPFHMEATDDGGFRISHKPSSKK